MIIGLFIYSSLYKSKFEEYIFLITPILVIGQFFYGLQLFIVDSLTFFNKTINLFIVSLSSVFFSVIIGYFLVDKFGILGGAIGIALSQLLSLIIVIFFTADLFKAILGFRFCIERIIRISLFILVPFIFYQAFGKIASISVCLIIVSYLVWKLNIPSLSKEFV
jgi:O-antigen/teichoic acid export membrane protein